jgi:hypothetical protein
MADRQRLVSGLIALAYLQAMWTREGWSGVLALLIPLSLPLGLIWYAGSISSSEAWGRAFQRIDRPTPPLAIRTLGWVFLLTPLAVIAVLWLRGH